MARRRRKTPRHATPRHATERSVEPNEDSGRLHARWHEQGHFFRDDWLPQDSALRDRILLRVIEHEQGRDRGSVIA
ncbi:hypothetical protein BURKHO8Y_20023 [Burkholderia sp. 8Y]|nr:hypothetical protein BURKHO8Y_20023 [Burkholderia sp. 8Y]